MRSQSVIRRGERLSIIIVYSRPQEEKEVSDEQEDVITRSPSILEGSADARPEICRQPPNPSRISTSPIATTSASLQEKGRANVAARVGGTSRRCSWPWLSIGSEIKAPDLRTGPITTRTSARELRIRLANGAMSLASPFRSNLRVAISAQPPAYQSPTARCFSLAALDWA